MNESKEKEVEQNQPQITKQIDGIDSDLNALGNVVDHLVEKLESIVIPPEKQEKNSPPEGQIVMCPLAERILSQRARIESYMDRMEDILRRIEL